MSKVFGALLVTCFVAVFAFQNCQQKQNATQNESDSSTGLRVVSATEIDINRVSQVNFNIQEVENILKSGRSFELQVNKSLQVNLLSGELNVVSDLSTGTEKYCLTENLLTELQSILQSSKVCKYQSAAGEMCAEVIMPAYAEVITDSAQIELGYASNACRDNMLDLCDNQATVLRSYLANLKSTYKNLKCSN